eukprot:SAG31_NODE_2786_length_5092_cov_3.254556_3_plen_81_part_00
MARLWKDCSDRWRAILIEIYVSIDPCVDRSMIVRPVGAKLLHPACDHRGDLQDFSRYLKISQDISQDFLRFFGPPRWSER